MGAMQSDVYLLSYFSGLIKIVWAFIIAAAVVAIGGLVFLSAYGILFPTPFFSAFEMLIPFAAAIALIQFIPSLLTIRFIAHSKDALRLD